MDLRVSFPTHPVICHITLSWYIVSTITCSYLSFLLSSNPTLLDRCVFADKLGYLKSFSLRGLYPSRVTLPRLFSALRALDRLSTVLDGSVSDDLSGLVVCCVP